MSRRLRAMIELQSASTNNKGKKLSIIQIMRRNSHCPNKILEHNYRIPCHSFYEYDCVFSQKMLKEK